MTGPEQRDWNLTRDEFTDALRKGLGRALLHVHRYGAVDRLDLIINACEADQRYDAQCELRRHVYLYEIAVASGKATTIREHLTSLVRASTDEADIWTTLAVLAWFARCGDPAALVAVRERFERDAARGSHDSGDEMIMAEPITGLLRVARAFADEFESHQRWIPLSWLNDASELDGQTEVREVLTEAAGSDERVAAFLNLATQPPETLYDFSETTPEEDGPLPDVMEYVLDSADPPADFYKARFRVWRWVDRATEEQRLAAARAIAKEEDPERVALLCSVFRYPKRPFPLDVGLLIDKARASTDERERHCLLRILEPHEDVRVRKLALELLQRHGPDSDILNLFIANYGRGDGSLLLRALTDRPLDEYEKKFDNLHGVTMAISKVFASESRTDGRESLLWAYEHTPCSMCRRDMVEALIRMRAAPEWLLQECLCDCVAETRSLVGKSIESE